MHKKIFLKEIVTYCYSQILQFYIIRSRLDQYFQHISNVKDSCLSLYLNVPLNFQISSRARRRVKEMFIIILWCVSFVGLIYNLHHAIIYAINWTYIGF